MTESTKAFGLPVNISTTEAAREMCRSLYDAGLMQGEILYMGEPTEMIPACR